MTNYEKYKKRLIDMLEKKLKDARDIDAPERLESVLNELEDMGVTDFFVCPNRDCEGERDCHKCVVRYLCEESEEKE